jgi:organic radical activating enzyme
MAKFDIKKFFKENKSYCPLPFKEIYSGNDGIYKLCCEADKSGHNYTTRDTTPFKFFDSPEMEEVRDKMMNGEKLKECGFCYRLEEKGYPSYRTSRYSDGVANFFPNAGERNISIKLKMLGSLCNLECYMCHPGNSSGRRNQLKKMDFIGDEDIGFSLAALKRKAPTNYVSWNDIITELLDNIHRIEKIHMIGGEPLQLPKHWELVDKIPPEHAKHIRVSYDTNATMIRYKNHTIWDVIDKFHPDTWISVSADHYGEREAWIRHPKDIESFERNLDEIKEYVGQVHITVSLLNIYDLFEIREYYNKKFGLQCLMNNTVMDPRMLSIKNLPDKEKEKLIEKYKDADYDFTEYEGNRLVAEMEKPRVEEEYQAGLKYMRELSKIRGDYTKLWPNII